MKHGISDIDPTVRAAHLGHVHHGRQRPSPSPKYQKAKILAVDDNVVVATLLALTLKASGHAVTSVFNGKSAIAHLQLEAFDMVILDLHLPDYSGFEVLEIIRIQRLCPRTPVIIVSSSDEAYDISRARHLGAAGYFAKVVSPETLPDKIEQVLTNRDMIWIDDYHCVIDPAVHRLHYLPRCDVYPPAPQSGRTIGG